MLQISPEEKSVSKAIKKIDDIVKEIYKEDLEEIYIPEIKNIILQNYDTELTGRVVDRKSKTNPIYYREEFEDALDEFEYIKTGKDYTTLVVPDFQNFNWNQGRLRIIENIVEGTLGNYVEADEEQYIILYNRRPIIEPYDKTVPRKERIYLLRYTVDLQRREQEKFGERVLVRYPFSNTAPIRIFDEADKYVENNVKYWMDESIKRAQKEITR